MFTWPGAFNQGHGEAVVVIDERASPAQREALLRIVNGQDTEAGATFFQVFSSMLEKVYAPIFGKIELDVDVEARQAQLVIDGIVKADGEPIFNPVTGKEYRARFDLPEGFNSIAEAGRGWAEVVGPIQFDLAD